MYNNITLGLRKRLLAGSTFALLSLSAAPALATDWWMIFGTGDTPNRDLFFADAQSVKATQQDPQNTQLTVVQVFESPNSPNYVSYTLELQCAQRQLRVNSATAYLRAGATTVRRRLNAGCRCPRAGWSMAMTSPAHQANASPTP